MCTTLWPRPLKFEVSGPHFKRDTRPKLHRVKWMRRMCFNVCIAVTTVPFIFQQRNQRLDEAIHIKHKTYCAHSALLDYSSIDGPNMIGDSFPTLPIAVTKAPSTFQQRIQGLDEAIHNKHKSYCAHSPHRLLATGRF